MSSAPGVAEVFRMLQAGDVGGALEASRRLLSNDPSNARAHLAAGIALRMAGRHEEARSALDRAQQLDPGDHAAAYEAGLVAQAKGDNETALERFEHSARLRPAFFGAHFAAGLLHAERREWQRAAACFRRVLELRPGEPQAFLQLALALAGDARHDEARAVFDQAITSHPTDVALARAHGQHEASRGEFARAASQFARALALVPQDRALAMYLAQCELLVGRWRQGWSAYAAREPRVQHERAAAARGKPYAIPSLDDLGRPVTVLGEQGLGDTLFFLRWAPALRASGARLRFAGDRRLHPLLERTGLFEDLRGPEDDSGETVVLAGDLPQVLPSVDPPGVASLRIAPLAERVARWRSALEAAGPRPWVGVAWRAGTSQADQPHALSKNVPIEALFGALQRNPGTLVAIQRLVRPGELELAARAAGRAVQDFSAANEDLEDILALVALLDRHVAVSSTSTHLAAAAGAVADVLVPFPPEWRWRPQGDSPWFPGFRVHRQAVDGDWSGALEAAARGPQGTGLQ